MRKFVIARNWVYAQDVLRDLGFGPRDWAALSVERDVYRLRGYDRPTVLVIGDVHIGQETRDALRASRARVYYLREDR